MGTRAITGKVRGMPDQSSASSEHALMQEITAPLSTLPDDPFVPSPERLRAAVLRRQGWPLAAAAHSPDDPALN